jgi:hypothetical protein
MRTVLTWALASLSLAAHAQTSLEFRTHGAVTPSAVWSDEHTLTLTFEGPLPQVFLRDGRPAVVEKKGLSQLRMPLTQGRAFVLRRGHLEGYVDPIEVRKITADLAITGQAAPHSDRLQHAAPTPYALMEGERLDQALTRWASVGGWTLEWATYETETWTVFKGATFSGDFIGALETALQSLREEGIPVRAKVFRGNQHVTIETVHP